MVTSARDPLLIGERAIDLAEAAGADEVEAVVSADEARLTRFANSEIHQNVAETDESLNLRVAIGRRVGVASSNRLDDESLRRLAERAVAIARNSAELEDWAGLPEPTPIVEIPAGWSDGTAESTPELRAEGVRAVIAAADSAGVRAFGSFSTSAERLAVANSKGIRAEQRRTTAQLLTVMMAAHGGSGYAEAAGVDATTIDAATIGREAADKARSTENPVSIDPGDWPVVLE
ncbi:MAG TPA: DNA gyrase modulator, partial [Candidatus Limnocylindrales bacterium]